jgi:hypothetical protein
MSGSGFQKGADACDYLMQIPHEVVAQEWILRALDASRQ